MVGSRGWRDSGLRPVTNRSIGGRVKRKVGTYLLVEAGESDVGLLLGCKK